MYYCFTQTYFNLNNINLIESFYIATLVVDSGHDSETPDSGHEPMTSDYRRLRDIDSGHDSETSETRQTLAKLIISTHVIQCTFVKNIWKSSSVNTEKILEIRTCVTKLMYFEITEITIVAKLFESVSK